MKTNPGARLPPPPVRYCDRCKAHPDETHQVYSGYLQVCEDRAACHRRRMLPRLRVIAGGFKG